MWPCPFCESRNVERSVAIKDNFVCWSCKSYFEVSTYLVTIISRKWTLGNPDEFDDPIAKRFACLEID